MIGYKDYKTYERIMLYKNGFNSYDVSGRTKLGKLIQQAQKELKGCLVWYRIDNERLGIVTIIYKEYKEA